MVTPIVTPVVTPMVIPEVIPMVIPEVTPMIIPEVIPMITPKVTPMIIPEVIPMVTPVTHTANHQKESIIITNRIIFARSKRNTGYLEFTKRVPAATLRTAARKIANIAVRRRICTVTTMTERAMLSVSSLKIHITSNMTSAFAAYQSTDIVVRDCSISLGKR